MRQPIITYPSRIPRWVQFGIASAAIFGLLFAGFVLGIAASHYAPSPKSSAATVVPIPQQNPKYLSTTDTFTTITPNEPTNDRWTFKDLKSEVKCLADNMYFEGRNQTTRGKIGIGLVTINRVKSKHFKNSICEVVWFKARDHRSGKITAHFSWTLDGKSDKIAEKDVYKRIYRIASAMLAESTLDNFHDFTDGATHYHADYIKPYWADSMNKVAQIGDHVYYR